MFSWVVQFAETCELPIAEQIVIVIVQVIRLKANARFGVIFNHNYRHHEIQCELWLNTLLRLRPVPDFLRAYSDAVGFFY